MPEGATATVEPVEVDAELAAKIAAMTDSDLYDPASKEHKAAKAAHAAGEPRPPTPHLDEMHRRHEGGITVKRSKSKSTRAPRPSIRFYRDGKPMPDSQNKLSSCAYYFTRNIDGSKPRIGTGALEALIRKLGKVSDPYAESWDVTLPNGTVLSARLPGDKKALPVVAKKAATKRAPAAKKKAAPRKSSPKKASAKKAAPVKRAPRKAAAKNAAPRKATAAKKAAPAKKAPAKKEVSPRFKK